MIAMGKEADIAHHNMISGPNAAAIETARLHFVRITAEYKVIQEEYNKAVAAERQRLPAGHARTH